MRCRTNSLCSAPVGLVCAASSTAQVELRWHAPKSLGNETTKDKFQESKEMVQAYKARAKRRAHTPAESPSSLERQGWEIGGPIRCDVAMLSLRNPISHDTLYRL